MGEHRIYQSHALQVHGGGGFQANPVMGHKLNLHSCHCQTITDAKKTTLMAKVF